jgi:probable F420-dependent oxidoreductase
MKLGKIGIWTTALDFQPSAKAREAVAELEALGYGALWIGEAIRREPFANAGILLSATERIVYATGIANIYARDAAAMIAGQKTLAEAFPDRFLLGLGVSHPRLIEPRGHQYEKPVAAMRAYLDAMDSARFDGVGPAQPPPRVLAALGPKMLELARDRSWGAHPYFVPVEHTVEARRVLGQGPLLAPEQAVVLEDRAERARAIARAHTRAYLKLPNYANNLRRLGYGEADLQDGGSDRLVDSIVAWGDVEKVQARIEEHIRAGADHVSVQVLIEDRSVLPMREWRTLAEALL